MNETSCNENSLPQHQIDQNARFKRKGSFLFTAHKMPTGIEKLYLGASAHMR